MSWVLILSSLSLKFASLEKKNKTFKCSELLQTTVLSLLTLQLSAQLFRAPFAVITISLGMLVIKENWWNASFFPEKNANYLQTIHK